MKQLFSSLLLLFFFQTIQLHAQSTCLNFTGTTQQYLQDISINNTQYPVGSMIFQTGHIRVFKVGIPTQYISASGDSICYIGKIEFNLATAPFPQRQFSFYSTITQGLVIDGDTIFQNMTPPTQYSGNGFNVAYAANQFTITGTFDTVHIFGSTNCMNTICLNQMPSTTQLCMDFGTSVTAQYCNDISMNHALYPVGSVLFQSPPIRIIKADTTTIFLNARNDTIWYIGRLLIDVSTAAFPNRRLTFNSIFVSGSIVDGDTTFQTTPPPAQYSGPNYQFIYNNPQFQYSGAFDSVLLYGSTNIVNAICLDSAASISQDCINFTGTSGQYLQDISMNNTLYPAGSIVFQSGDIRIRKVAVPTQFISASGDTLCYIGKIEIDVSQASYSPRKLTFHSIITQGMVIDGDTIFQNSNPPALYNGNGFTLAYLNNHFTITGAFDTVHIFGSTNCLSAICLENISTGLQSETTGQQVLVFPNPSSGWLNFNDLNHEALIQIYTLQGVQVYSGRLEQGNTRLDLSLLPDGLYWIQLQSVTGEHKTIRWILRR
jgi:hypothetical protein